MATAGAIPPGGEGEVNAVFKTKGRRGKTTKRITVMSNDPDNPKMILTLKGEIVLDVVTTPSSLSFGTLTKKEAAEKEFELAVSEPEKVKVTSVSCEDERFEIKLKEGDPSKQAKYTVKFKGAEELGRVTTAVKINVEGTEVENVDLPIRLRVVGNLKFPSSVYFAKRNNEFRVRDIKIEHRKGETFKVLKVDDPLKHLKIKMDIKEGTVVPLSISVADPNKDYEKPVRGELKIKTNTKDEPELTIRYTISSALRNRSPVVDRKVRSSVRRARRTAAIGDRPLIKTAKDTKTK